MSIFTSCWTYIIFDVRIYMTPYYRGYDDGVHLLSLNLLVSDIYSDIHV